MQTYNRNKKQLQFFAKTEQKCPVFFYFCQKKCTIFHKMNKKEIFFLFYKHLIFSNLQKKTKKKIKKSKKKLAGIKKKSYLCIVKLNE